MKGCLYLIYEVADAPCRSLSVVNFKQWKVNLPGFSVVLWYCGILLWIIFISYPGMLCFVVQAYKFLVYANFHEQVSSNSVVQ